MIELLANCVIGAHRGSQTGTSGSVEEVIALGVVVSWTRRGKLFAI